MSINKILKQMSYWYFPPEHNNHVLKLFSKKNYVLTKEEKMFIFNILFSKNIS